MSASADRTTTSATTQRFLRRLIFLIPAGVAMVLGLNAGLQRLPTAAPLESGRLAGVHGIIMVLGFVGTLISLERSVALARWWGFISPAALGIGGLLLVTPAPLIAGQALLLIGSIGLVAVYVALYQRNHDSSVALQAVGGVLLVGGSLLWLRGVGIEYLIPWLGGFVVLTIVGERLELARIAISASATESGIIAICAAFAASVPAAAIWPTVGYPMLGASTIAIIVWLSAHDVARKTINATGLPRFIAACLLIGYAWLGIAGVIWLLSSKNPEGAAYDAVVHCLFLGFTISMIMAHAPVILPAVLRISLPYRRSMIMPAAVLHGSLVLRIVIGDWHGDEVARTVGGILNVVALLLFALVSLTIAVTSRPKEAAS